MTTSTEPRSSVGPALPRARPHEVGVPPAAVEAVLDALAGRDLELHSLVVVRRGHVAAEGWWAPYSAERIHLLYSLSKSFTSTAVGFAVAEGRFALEDRVVDLLPDRAPAEVDPRVAELTVHHLLSMSTGHRDDTIERAYAGDPDDLVAGFLRVPPDEPVGSRHAYNNPTTRTLAALVEARTGEPLLDYLRPRLLDPIGAGPARWDEDAHGVLGFTGLHLRTEAVASFGQLLLDDGVRDGRRVLPDGWVSLATRQHIHNDDDPERPVDWRQGYGYQYWMARHGFRGDGAYGQFCVVVPEQQLVVATTACVEDMQAVLDVLWEHLLPALADAVPEDPGAEERLRRRLRALALPVVTPAADAPARAASAVVGGDDPTAPLPTGTRVDVTPTTDGDHAITLHLAAADVAVRCGRDAWLETVVERGGTVDRGARGIPPSQPVPVVARGGWTGPDTFAADVVLIESPHRIRLQANGSRATAWWNHPPLASPRLEAMLPRPRQE